MLRAPHVSRLALVAAVSAAGCATLIGLPDYGAGVGGAGGGNATGTGGSGKTSSTGVTVGSGGATSSGGATGGSSAACQAGAPCYFGLDGTEGVGPCRGGTLSCDGGVAACSDVRPAVQSCAAPQSDGNCDGMYECTGAFRWAQTGFTVVTTALAAGADGTVALAGALNTPTSAGNVWALTFDARGRRCWSAATILGGAGVLAPLGAAVSGAWTTPDHKPAQAICGPGGSGLAASTVIVGQSTGTVDFGGVAVPNAGGNDAFVALVGSTGTVVWGKAFGSAGDDQVAAVTTDADGGIYVTGSVKGPADIAGCGNVLDGGVVGGDPSAFIAKLGPDGECGWLDLFTGNAAGTAIALGKGGTSVVAAGLLYGGEMDFPGGAMVMPGPANVNNTFVVRVDAATGAVMGTPTHLDVANQGLYPSLAVGPDDTVFLAGTYLGVFGICTATTNTGGYLAQLTATLTPLGSHHCYSASASNVGAFGVTVDAAGNALLGLFSSTAGGVSGNTGFATPIPGSNVIVAKLASPYDDYLWAATTGPPGTAYPGGLAVDGMGDVMVTANTNAAISLGGETVGGQNVSFVAAFAP